jgi:hypothetical protein
MQKSTPPTTSLMCVYIAYYHTVREDCIDTLTMAFTTTRPSTVTPPITHVEESMKVCEACAASAHSASDFRTLAAAFWEPIDGWMDG